MGYLMVRALSAPLRDKGSFGCPPHPPKGKIGPMQCLWCQAAIPARRQHGSKRKFCCPLHRQAFWQALRRYGLAQFLAGRITLEMLKGEQRSVDALSEALGGDATP